MSSQSRRSSALVPAPEPLPVPVVDSHCHLDMARDGAPAVPAAEALAAAAAVGVDRVVQVGCELAGARWTVEAVQDHAALLGAVALHPTEATRLGESGGLAAALEEIERLVTAHPRIRAVGETGLDHYWVGEDGRPAQEESFRAHIAMARAHDKTLMIHDRDAHADVLRVLADEGPPDRVIMHCFSGDADFARECVRAGYYLSFAGTVTFGNAPALREAAAVVPRELLLAETDAPFLTPHPFRGRPNGPYLLPLTVRVLAGARGEDLAETCAAVSRNAVAAFGSWD